jgi:hypothetical protein
MIADITYTVIVLSIILLTYILASGPYWKIDPKREYYKAVSLFGKPYYVGYSPGGVAIWKKFKTPSPFKRIMITDSCVEHSHTASGPSHNDCIYTTIKYRVDPKKIMDILRVSDTVMYDKLREELTVRCNSIEDNIAVLVLVDSVHQDLVPSHLVPDEYEKSVKSASKNMVTNYRTLQIIQDKYMSKCLLGTDSETICQKKCDT